MPLKNYTTDVSAAKTVSEIHLMLAEHGARQIMFNYDDKNHVISICFSVPAPNGEQAVKLPANVPSVQEVLRQQKKNPKIQNRTKIDDSYEQAERVAWRIIRDWLSAQLAILETEMVTVQQVFLPYFMNRAGQTVYQLYENGSLPFMLE